MITTAIDVTFFDVDAEYPAILLVTKDDADVITFRVAITKSGEEVTNELSQDDRDEYDVLARIALRNIASG